jgi:hypothetical protein
MAATANEAAESHRNSAAVGIKDVFAKKFPETLILRG